MTNDSFWTWIEQHLNDDATRLRLKFTKADLPFDVALAILQIECRKKYAKKFNRTLSACPHFLFPDSIAAEQATSDLLATYHASLINDGDSVIDLTAGLGIDAMHCATKAKSVTACEQRDVAAQALQHNAEQSGLTDFKVFNGDCRDFLNNNPELKVDTIFIDPARRADDGSRIYALSDCMPNVVEMLPLIRSHCNRLIIKASPMLDIAKTISELGTNVSRIIALGNHSECKELIAVMDFSNVSEEPTIEAVTLDNEGAQCVFSFAEHDDERLTINYATPTEGAYLYEPYPATMKAGAFKLLADRFKLTKLSGNTHLYFGDKAIEDFPGDRFKIERVIPYASKNIKRFKKEYPKISVAVRNFGISADNLRSKLGVSDGGDLRVIGVTNSSDDRLLLVLRRN
jgi:predicted RNA methylase